MGCMSASLWNSMGCRDSCFTLSCTTACRGICPLGLGPSLVTDLGVCRVDCLVYSHSTLLWMQLLLHNNFFTFLNILLQRCYHHFWLVQRWQQQAGPPWIHHWLCPTQRKLLAAAYRSHPCSPPLATKNLSHKHNVQCKNKTDVWTRRR